MLKDLIITALKKESCPISNHQLLRSVSRLTTEDYSLNKINSAIWGLAASQVLEITPQNLIKLKGKL